MSSARQVDPLPEEEIWRQWDRVASIRREQFDAGSDLSFEHVLWPELQRLLRLGTDESVIDVGCGTGVLTARIAEFAHDVLGVDPSINSIGVARASTLQPNVTFLTGTVQQASREMARRFNVAVAHMSLMDAPDLDEVIAAIARLLVPGGRFVATVTHPCFWPQYWEYSNEPWFQYSQEQYIEAEFRISAGTTGLLTTHIHRPVSHYVNTLLGAGFTLESLSEPMPSESVMERYSTPWTYPRFMILTCVRNPHS